MISLHLEKRSYQFQLIHQDALRRLSSEDYVLQKFSIRIYFRQKIIVFPLGLLRILALNMECSSKNRYIHFPIY